MLYIVGTAVMNTWASDVRVQTIAELKTTSNYEPVVGMETCRNSGRVSILGFQKSFLFY